MSSNLQSICQQTFESNPRRSRLSRQHNRLVRNRSEQQQACATDGMVWYVSSPGAWLVATSTVNRFPAEYTIIPAVARDRLVNIPAQLAKGRHVLHRINAMQSESPLYLRQTEMSSTCSLPMEEMCSRLLYESCSCKLQRYDSRGWHRQTEALCWMEVRGVC